MTLIKKLKLTPNSISGTVAPPPSKSISHRAIICAGLADGISKIDNLIYSEDIIATMSGLEALGAKASLYNDQLALQGVSDHKCEEAIIDCNESGSTIRFMIPLASILSKKTTVIGSQRLSERPLTSYYNIFDQQHLSYSTNNNHLPLVIKDQIKPDTFSIEGNISSQFISGLLFALPLLPSDSKILITTPLESIGYVDLTIDMLKQFGILIKNKDYTQFEISGNQAYQSQDITIESDFSQAAFWIVAGLIGKEMQLKNMDRKSLQGDQAIVQTVINMGGKIVWENDLLTVFPSKTFGTIIDVSQIPDLVPILAVLASVSKGTTKLINGARLRIKESDRLTSTATELAKLGANIHEENDGLVIEGKEMLEGGEVDSWNDHRIAMAMAIASIRCKSPVIINGFESVKKSYPHFWEDFKQLGGNIHELNLG